MPVATASCSSRAGRIRERLKGQRSVMARYTVQSRANDGTTELVNRRVIVGRAR